MDKNLLDPAEQQRVLDEAAKLSTITRRREHEHKSWLQQTATKDVIARLKSQAAAYLTQAEELASQDKPANHMLLKSAAIRGVVATLSDPGFFS